MTEALVPVRSVEIERIERCGEYGNVIRHDVPNPDEINHLVSMGNDIPQTNDLKPRRIGNLEKTLLINLSQASQVFADDLQAHPA